MKQAVIEADGKQYNVVEGQIVPLRLSKDANERVEFDTVLSLFTDEKQLVGTPYIEGAKVVGTIMRRAKGKKIVIETYKAKSNYHRKLGFRPFITYVQINTIQSPK